MNVPRLFASAAVAAALSAPLFAQSGGHIGPTGGEVAGAAVGVGAAVAVVAVLAVHHSHHVLTGCVVSGPQGLGLQTSDSRTWALEGDAAALKVGDRVKIHGSRVKKPEGASRPESFRVDKLNKDYGNCHGR